MDAAQSPEVPSTSLHYFGDVSINALAVCQRPPRSSIFSAVRINSANSLRFVPTMIAVELYPGPQNLLIDVAGGSFLPVRPPGRLCFQQSNGCAVVVGYLHNLLFSMGLSTSIPIKQGEDSNTPLGFPRHLARPLSGASFQRS